MANKITDTAALASVESAQAAGIPLFRFTTDGRRPEIEKNFTPEQLEAYLNDIAIKALPDGGDGKLRVRLIASTSMRDLAGDTFTQKALGEMESQAVGTTMFLNHKKSVPEDVFGTVEKAQLVTRTVKDAHGGDVKVAALEYTVVVAASNPRAKQTYDQIANGEARLGASVTVAVLDKQPQSKGVGDIINGIYYIECSVVGVPMNPASFVEYAQKSLEVAPASITISAGAAEAASPAAASAATQDQTTGVEGTAPPPAAQKSVAGGGAQAPTLQSALAEVVEPGTDPATIYVKGKFLEMALSYLKEKGLFADELAKRKPTFYELYDCFTSIVYRLWRLKNANQSAGVEDVYDYRGAITDCASEFAASLVETAGAYLGLDGADPDADSAMVSSYSLETLKGLEVLAKSYVDGGRKAGDDAAVWQQVHDAAVACGVKCEKSAEGVAGAATENARPEGEVVSKSIYDKLSLENETWKAIGQGALAQLSEMLSQPLPRAGQ